MAAFERVRSGIPQMDQAVDYIRLGDNVVWQVTTLEEFRIFLEPYVKQATRDGRNIIYIRFASHAPLVKEQAAIRVEHVELSHRFETFTVEIHNIIEREGKDAFYVFDCLSELQTAWATDLMMGNFFRVTCPYLFSLDTVAYFPLIRGKHSFEAIAKIRDTAQVFFDVYSDEENVYVRPIKVWNRYSDTMFLPHAYQQAEKKFQPLMEGVSVSRFYQLMNHFQTMGAEQSMDSWDRFFAETAAQYAQGKDVRDACGRMCRIMMTRDEKLRRLVKENFAPEDYFAIRGRMIGTGMIGGKACGMLLARKLVENKRPDIYERLEPHDSFYIGSDVFYSFIVHNDFWDLRIRQRRPQEYFSLADIFAKHLKEGEFPGSIQEQFMRMLDYYGQAPIIVRSSSILEDGFGNAFAGKYESVFCLNSGSREECLQEFENAVRTVYASTMSRSALDYRLRRGLDRRDEQMALLVQRVSGSRYPGFFMPCAAGVGYSYSPYKFHSSLDAGAGMLRLVMGLGTGAVDRAQGSYPRLVSLDQPEMTAVSGSAQKHQFSQRRVDVIDTATGQVEHKPYDMLLHALPDFLKELLLEHDYEAESMFRERGQRREVLFVSCSGLVRKRQLMEDLRRIMALIQEAYAYPVDIEYTVNVSAQGEYVINLLQCRPLQVAKDQETVRIPENIPQQTVLLECCHASMGLSRRERLDYIVMVAPAAYYRMDYREKSQIARVIGTLNWKFRNQGTRMMLLVPGRIGTSSPELGVPTTFADISEFDAVCEIAESSAGYLPELSYGSHIFQDLVEAGILYVAIFENEKTKRFCPEMLTTRFENKLETFAPAAAAWKEIIGVYDVSEAECILYHDMAQERVVCVLGECSASQYTVY